MKKFIIGVLFFATAIGLLFYFAIKKPHKNVADEQGVQISAAQLFVE